MNMSESPRNDSTDTELMRWMQQQQQQQQEQGQEERPEEYSAEARRST